ncbi:MAG: PDZ domain-containing protein [Synechococcaceae bacterium WB6_3B_236]|nr:PDZ domain-containing protein [Synechococcaceae bacterium WB6_3B_236]
MGVLSALAILALLIVVHESGHFLAATWQGIRVSSFSVGFGPVLFERQRRGVQFALRAIPLGGFVAFPDDDPDSGFDPKDPDLLKNRPIPQRALVIAAGVLANLLFAWSVLVAQGVVVGIPAGFNPTGGILVAAVQPDQAAERAGLRAGDRLVGLGGQPLGGGSQAVQTLVAAVKAAPNRALTVEIERNGSKLQLPLTPVNQGGSGRIGAQLQPDGIELFRPAKGPGDTHFGETASQVSGPVKIVEMGAQLAHQGGGSLFLFTALISINLAVLNALPLPLLDGGQFVLLLLEGLRGRPLPDRLQMAFTQSGLVLLLGLSAVLIVKDTSQLSLVRQLLGH